MDKATIWARRAGRTRTGPVLGRVLAGLSLVLAVGTGAMCPATAVGDTVSGGDAGTDASGPANPKPSNADNQGIAPRASSTVLSVSPNPATGGQPITLTATVTCTSGTPTGSVVFSNTGVLGAATLSGNPGTASSTLPNGLPAGTYILTARYAGDGTCTAATSTPVSVTVNSLPASATTLSVSPNPVPLGQPVTLTATVTCSTPATGNHGRRRRLVPARGGMRVVAVADAAGTLYRPRRPRHPGAARPSRRLRRDRPVPGSTTGPAAPARGRGRDPAEIFVPAAISYAITPDNSADVVAKLILEAANAATTPEAEDLLTALAIPVIPDFVANAGAAA